MDRRGYGRIAKNTLMLYIRMILVMAITFATTRVAINVLGLEGYGIFSVVVGCVTMFAFLSGMLSGATQRFIAFALGQSDGEQVRRVYSVAFDLYILFGFILMLLAETIGLYLFKRYINIPADRMSGALWVYHFSVITLILVFFQSLFLAVILAYEKMEAYAYISICEVVLKLAVVFLLLHSPFDKLKLYAMLLCLVSVVTCLLYYVYCRIKFRECRYVRVKDRTLCRALLGFSGWNFFGCLAKVCSVQGVSVLLNIFFGPVINAATAVTFQISNGVTTFVSGFQASVSPQVVKNYSAGDLPAVHRLIYQSSKYSYCLLWLLALPLFLEMDIILQLWLKKVPEHTALFSRLVLIRCLVFSLNRPFVQAVHATGRLWQTNVTGGLVLLAALPVSYILLRRGFASEIVLIVSIVADLICFCIEFLFLKSWISISFVKTLKEVLAPVLAISLLTFGAGYALCLLLKPGIPRLILILPVSALLTVAFTYRIGLEAETRAYVKSKLKKLVQKRVPAC